jgi:hypothetical protein
MVRRQSMMTFNPACAIAIPQRPHDIIGNNVEHKRGS